MANERIEIDIVLNDGTVAKAFASITKESERTAKQIQRQFTGAEDSMSSSIENYRRSFSRSSSFFNDTFRGSTQAIGALDRQLRQADLESAFANLPSTTNKAKDAFDRLSGSFDNTLKNFASGTKSLFTLKNAIVGLAAASGAFVVAGQIKNFLNDIIREASEGEVEINNLANSLRSAGTLSAEAIKQFDDFSNTVERTTTVSKGQTLQIAALARNYSRTNEEAIKLTKASIQLSAATGVDLNSAVDQLGGTLQGIGGRLGKTIPGFKSLSEEALKSGAALDLVLSRFNNSAESKVQTFAGSIEQLKNQFNTFLGDVGDLIIRSPAVLAVFTEVGKIFTEFSASLSGLKDNNQDVLGPIIQQAIKLGLTFNDFVIRPFELLGNAVSVSFNLIKLQFNFAIAAIGKVSALIGGILKQFSNLTGVGGGVADGLLAFGESSEDQFLKQIAKTFDAAANVGSQSFSDGIENNLSRIGEAVSKASATLLPEVKNLSNDLGKNFSIAPDNSAELKAAEEYRKRLFDIKREALLVRTELIELGRTDAFGAYTQEIANIPSAMQIASATTVFEVEKIKAAITQTKDVFVSNGQQIKQALETGLTNSISSSISSVVGALAAGENAFEAFGKNLLGVIGDLAQQIGGFIIAAGIAKMQLFSGNPISTIAAGAALVAIGAALSAINKKGSSGGFAGAAPGSSLTPPLTPATPVSNASDSLNGDRRAQVNLTVEGNVYDPQGTGLAIAELLKNAGFDGAVVV